MQEINEHINQINTNYDPEISLADRRKQIYENSKLASTERAQRLMYIRKLEAEGKKLAKGNLKSTGVNSFYHKQMEEQKNMAFMKNRNPYHQRMVEIMEKGGITAEVTEAPVEDHVAQRWNERKGNYDKNGKLKPNEGFKFPKK
ncbi:hypothetical protein Zmor_004196 [Zophobas morio]|uniref:Uncharacterized protein n=1 Tax=Zophobas morio TaxID=2755281 RepID=A0AA38M0E3_9CUCU|nr:hypothetical protein Zmor_004196 [Zophobas morio]